MTLLLIFSNFLTLKSKKIYTGILIEYPESSSQHPQHILILPIRSGYRTTSGEAKWTTYIQMRGKIISSIISL